MAIRKQEVLLMATNDQKLQALKFAYQILTDKRNSERYALSFLQSKSSGRCMYYGEMLDTLDEIAKELADGTPHVGGIDNG